MRHHGCIPMCAAPAALAGGDAALMKRVGDPNDPRLLAAGRHYTNALSDFEPQKPYSGPGFADDQQYRYYHGIARAGGKVPPALAFKIVADAFTEPLLWRCYSDDAPVPAGINRFDLYPQYFVDGKPQHYRSDRKGPGGRPIPVGSRMGPQNMVCCGWALQVLREFPGIWEERYKRQFAKDLWVYIFEPVDKQGAQIFGIINASVPVSPVAIGNVEMSLTGGRTGLLLWWARCRGEQATIRIFSRPDAKGAHAIITVKRDKTLSAVNDKGEKLSVDGSVKPAEDGFGFHVMLPWTVTKGQKPWANGIEHGRYSIQVGKDVRNFYLAGSEKQVRERLQSELAGGLRTWEAIFDEYGYIPTGIGTGRFWDGFSDSGGYAHLISAAAQWVLYLQKKAAWQVPKIGRLPADRRSLRYRWQYPTCVAAEQPSDRRPADAHTSYRLDRQGRSDRSVGRYQAVRHHRGAGAHRSGIGGLPACIH